MPAGVINSLWPCPCRFQLGEDWGLGVLGPMQPFSVGWSRAGGMPQQAFPMGDCLPELCFLCIVVPSCALTLLPPEPQGPLL